MDVKDQDTLEEKWIENLGDNPDSIEVCYINNDGIQQDLDKTVEYEKGSYRNNWIQKIYLQLKEKDVAMTAYPADTDKGLIIVKFTKWRNPPTSKILDTFFINISEKVDIIYEYDVLIESTKSTKSTIYTRWSTI